MRKAFILAVTLIASLLFILPISITTASASNGIETSSMPQRQSATPLAVTPQPSWNPHAHFRLIFWDGFPGPGLNRVWTPGWFGTGITPPVNSDEIACYKSSNVSVSKGRLSLALRHTPSTCRGGTHPFTGSLVSTNGHFSMTYGRVEVRAYIPAASDGRIANWPAIWMDGQSWPRDGEADILEGLGGTAAFHFHSPLGGPGGDVPGNWTGWHTFGMYWAPGVAQFFYDGHSVGKVTRGITGSPQYIVLTNTIGPDSPRSPKYPAVMRVDWVRALAR